MANDEIRMANQIAMTKLQYHSTFGIGALFAIRKAREKP
jgi:hypothetical protein